MSQATQSEQSPYFALFVGAMLSILAISLTIALTDSLHERSPYLIPLASVAISAWYGGTAPAILTTIMTVIMVNVLLFEPQHVLSFNLSTLWNAVVYMFVAGLLIWTDAHRRRAASALKTARDELQIILDGIADGITVQTEDGQPVFANNAAATLLGYRTPADLIADTHQGRAQRFTMLDEADNPVPISSRPRSQVFRTGAAAAMSFKVRDNETGAIRWMHLKTSPVFDSRRRKKVAVNILQDVTAAKTHELELARVNAIVEENRARLDRLITHVPGMVYEGYLDPDTGIQRLDFVSPYAETLFGYTVDQIREKPTLLGDIIHTDDRQRLVNDIQAQLKNGDSVRTEFRALRADGTIISCETSFTLTRDERQQPIGTTGVIIDISARKETEEALVQYANELQRSNEELEQFAYVASHDLQEPLRMVASYLQLLEQRYGPQLDEDARDFIGFAVDGATRMKTLINDLLTYSRMQRTKLVMTKVSLDEVFARAQSNLALIIEDTGAVVTSDPLPTLVVHEGQFVQLMQNLLGNALKFRREIPPTVHVSAELADDEWVFSVKDNGIGIEARNLDRIFVIFQRLHSREQYPGTGIGLAICKKIVERHNGRIWGESTPGVGTTMYFALPVSMKKVLDGTR